MSDTSIIQDTINSHALLEALNDEQRQQLAEQAQLTHYTKGDIIVREGLPVESMYIIAKGVVRVSTLSMSREVELKRMGLGSYFGEVSLLSGKSATATVEADEDVSLVCLQRDALEDILTQNQTLRATLEGVTLARAKDTISKVLK